MQPSDRTRSNIYRFDAFVLDLNSGELRRDGVRVPLQDLPLRLLGMLAASAGEVVTRQELQKQRGRTLSSSILKMR